VGADLQNAAANPLTFKMPAKTVSLTANFEKTPTHAFTRTAGPGGSITENSTPDGSYAEDAKIEVAAKAENGWHFTSWTSVGADLQNAAANPLTFKMPASTVTLIANFEENPAYRFTRLAGEGGEITESSTEDGAYPAGTDIKIAARTEADWKFTRWTQWTASGQALSELTDLDDADMQKADLPTFQMPAEDVLLVANFRKDDRNTLMRVAREGGTVDGAPAKSSSHKAGETVVVTAEADSGWSFDGWTADGKALTPDEAQSASLTITMPDNPVLLVARFKKIVYRLTCAAGEGGKLYITNEAYAEYVEDYNAGAPVDITAAVVDENIWKFTKWIVYSTNGTALLENETEERADFAMPEGDVVLVANFEKKDGSPKSLYTFVCAAGTGGAVGGSKNGNYEAKTDITVTAAAVDANWEFDHWTAADDPDFWAGENPKPEDPEFAFKMPEKNVILIAHFKEKEEPPVPTHKFTRSAGEGGGVYGTPSGDYEQDTPVDIAAAPESGWTFADWTADGITLPDRAAKTLTFRMPANDVTLFANFKKTDTGGGGGGSGGGGGGGGGSGGCTVSYDANGGAGGRSVSGLSYGDRHTVLSRDEAEVSREDYNFTGWNTKADGSGGTYVPGGILTVSGNIVLYAQWTERGLLETQNHIVYLYGYPSGAVGADRAITRAEAAAVFYRLLTKPGAGESGEGFVDISGDEWYAAEVDRLTSLGILKGYPNGSFKPDKPITRAEFSAVASRFDELASVNGNAFVDVPAGHWAVGYINSAYAHGWIRGYPDGMFKPEAGITRAEVVTIVNAMLDRKIDAAALSRVANPYNDINTGHWAYADILEASTAHEYIRDEDGREIWLHP
jgi:uncharacterized repeat protein (TIGR02543 family)